MACRGRAPDRDQLRLGQAAARHGDARRRAGPGIGAIERVAGFADQRIEDKTPNKFLDPCFPSLCPGDCRDVLVAGALVFPVGIKTENLREILDVNRSILRSIKALDRISFVAERGDTFQVYLDLKGLGLR